MSIRLLRALIAIWILALAGSPIHAQLVSDGGTRTLANVTNVITGTVTVGTNGSFTILQLSDSALLTNSAHGVIGRNATTLFNEVRLTSATARWRMGANLYVGSNGASSLLAVSNGGRVENSDSFLGGNSASDGNLATVTDAGSLWSNRFDLHVGYLGSRNRMTVDNGGRVESRISHIGYFSTSSNNTAVVTGAGSIWSNRANLNVGFDGAGNRLLIGEGGRVENGDAFLANTSLSSNNEAVVTGAGSLWNNGLDLYAGYSGGGNRLVITNGGRVENRISHIGYFSTSDNNVAVVTGAGSTWSNRLNLNVGFDGSGNRVVITNGGTVFASNSVVIGFTPLSSKNRIVTDGGTLRVSNAAGNGALDVRRGAGVLNAGLVDVDKLVVTNKVTVLTPTLFGNGVSNYFPQFGNPTEYPSTINVSGLDGSITKVTVTLSNLSYTSPKALDILLVDPAGQKVMLMSDVGAGASLPPTTLSFDNAVANLLPASGPIVSGTYSPTDYDPSETLTPPAPARPYSSLDSFTGSIPNGVWSLFIAPNGLQSIGSLRGWSLKIATDTSSPEDGAAFELNGGTLISRGAVISNGLPFVVGGPGNVPAVWEARGGSSDNFVARNLLVGRSSSSNQLAIPSGVVSATSNIIVGASPLVSTNNLLRVTGGTLRVLSPGTSLDVRGGTSRLDAGLVDVNRLVVTNARGQFELNGGALRTLDTTIANGRVFTVGGGVTTATLELPNGTHTFADNLTVASNGSLVGTATIDGAVIVSPGGRLAPGASIGRIDVLDSVILQGAANLKIDKRGGVRTSDQVSASGAIFYGGTLNVTDIGTDVLSAGDRFFLFAATPYIGAFTTINLPPLPSGLSWRNNLSVDGSIEVTTAVVSTPGFSAIHRTGTNVVFTGTNGTPGGNYAVLTATNVTLPSSNWLALVTNQFNAGGAFSFTNAIAPGDLQRFFQLRTP